MHTDEEIKKEGFRLLSEMTSAELETLTEIDFEVVLKNSDGGSDRYTIFFERGFANEKSDWTVRNIIRPDKLQDPERKEDNKIE